MTLLSVIIPVYRVEEFLPKCLDSVLGQAVPGIEVIAVDDASDDGSAQILSWYAERHSRLTVVTLPRNGGLGAARNAGLARATGRYVWYVDSDDWLTDGALPAVADRLAQTGPDLLVTGYTRVYGDGRTEPHGVAEVAAGPETFTLAERPGLLGVLWIACNKVFRRQFLADQALAFAPGWYEDVAYVVPLMVAAERISVLDRTCYAYRQRPGAITRTLSERHFDVFDQWERVFAYLAARPERAATLRPLIFRRMIWHCLQVLGHPNRVPRARRREFFARTSALYRRHFPPGGAALPAGNEGVKQRLVSVGAYGLFETMMAAWLAGKEVRRMVPRVAGPRPDDRSPAEVG